MKAYFGKESRLHPIRSSCRRGPFAQALCSMSKSSVLAGSFLLLPLAPAGAADVPFSTLDLGSNAFGPVLAEGADIDGDGDLDAVVANFYDSLEWYENSGGSNPTFSVRTISGGTASNCLVTVDLDGDGDIDILTCAVFGDQINWQENDGAANPSFTKHTISTNTDGPRKIFASDIDSDGDLDLLVASYVDNRIAWFENDGASTPTFSVRTITTSALDASDVVAVDLDGDGDVDALSASPGDNSVEWFSNNGLDNPDFSRRVISTVFTGAKRVEAADVDDDGDLDVLAANEQTLVMYESDGAALPQFTLQTLATNLTSLRELRTADVDQDGDLDVITIDYINDTIVWLENDGAPDPGFTQRSIGPPVGHPSSASVADMDQDGDSDVLGTSYGAGDVLLHRNQKIHRNADFPEAITISTLASGARSVFTADIDGDGDEDVLSASSYDDIIAWYENNGASTPAFTRRLITTTADGASYVYAVDVDQDGDLDVVSASLLDDKIAWYRNNGSGFFEIRTVSLTANAANSVFAADLDGDGHIDLLSSSASDDKIAWYQSNGAADPTFTIRTISVNADSARSVYAADMDRDGDIDVLSASANDDKIAWYENNGNSSPGFTVRTVSVSADGASSVFAADLDADGDLDILATLSGSDAIVWFESDGSADPIFLQRHTLSTSADNAFHVIARDLDGDGDLDVVSAAADNSQIAWFENDGATTPSFTPHTIAATADRPFSVAATDLDGDGDLDLLSASLNDARIAWYENRGGQFALPTLDLAPDFYSPGQNNVPVLRIDAEHLGRSGDSPIELSTLALLIDDGVTPLSTAQANALIDNIHVYQDTGNGALEPASDILVTSLNTLNLSAGVQTITFNDGDPSVTFAAGVPQTYFVALDANANADAQTPNSLRVRHHTDVSSSAEDANADIPVSLQDSNEVSSGLMQILDTSPDTFNLVDRTDRPTAARISSNTITISGINSPTPLSISAVGTSERYEINGGPLSEGPAALNNGDTLRVSVISPGAANTSRSVTVTVGDFEEVWNVTTGAVDETPGPIVFNNINNAAQMQTVLSNTVTLSNFNAATSIQIRGAASAMYAINGGPFTKANGTVNPGDTIQLRMDTAGVGNATRRAFVIVGRIRGRWEVTTAP